MGLGWTAMEIKLTPRKKKQRWQGNSTPGAADKSKQSFLYREIFGTKLK